MSDKKATELLFETEPGWVTYIPELSMIAREGSKTCD